MVLSVHESAFIIIFLGLHSFLSPSTPAARCMYPVMQRASPSYSNITKIPIMSLSSNLRDRYLRGTSPPLWTKTNKRNHDKSKVVPKNISEAVHFTKQVWEQDSTTLRCNTPQVYLQLYWNEQYFCRASAAICHTCKEGCRPPGQNLDTVISVAADSLWQLSRVRINLPACKRKLINWVVRTPPATPHRFLSRPRFVPKRSKWTNQGVTKACNKFGATVKRLHNTCISEVVWSSDILTWNFKRPLHSSNFYDLFLHEQQPFRITLDFTFVPRIIRR